MLLTKKLKPKLIKIIKTDCNLYVSMLAQKNPPKYN